MSYVHEQVLKKITALKNAGKLEDALKLVNSYLVDDPSSQVLLMEIADIHYRGGELEKSSKPVDFLLSQNPDDPINLYIKGIIEMDKKNW
jgi:predicted Zn-dependent protease